MNYRCFRSKSPYPMLLEKFSLPTLKLRRALLDQLLLYKICHNKFCCIELVNQIIRIHVPYRTTSRETRKHKLFAPTLCKTNAGERAPLVRITKSFNQHFTDVDLFASSPALFKKSISQILLAQDTLPVSCTRNT